jgi:replicative DNA helicase
MPLATLLDRQLARVSGVPLTLIRHRQLGREHDERIDRAMATLEPLLKRFAMVKPPFNLENTAASADAFESKVILLDYIQRISPPGVQADQRGAVNATMNFLRQFADEGQAVIVISAVGRTRDANGRASYASDGLNLASFRESSELEFGCDSAYILISEKSNERGVILRHLKSRHREIKDIVLDFDRRIQRFTPRLGVEPCDEAEKAKFRKRSGATAATEEETEDE